MEAPWHRMTLLNDMIKLLLAETASPSCTQQVSHLYLFSLRHIGSSQIWQETNHKYDKMLTGTPK